MSRRNLAWLLSICALFGLGLAVSHSSPAHDREYELVHLVVDVLTQVRKNYVTDIDPDRERKLVEDMINGGLERLDPHSAYINPKDYKQFDKISKGTFGGIGIQMGYDRQNRGQLMVISPMVGTPAYEKGVLAGDMILKIDGKSTENMRISDAVDIIQGEPGQAITLTVQHEGSKDPIDVEITRAEIRVQSVLGERRLPDDPKQWDFFIDHSSKIGYIRLVNFSETAAKEMEDAVEKLEAEGVRGLIIDVRNNPGGLLTAAVEISDLFLTDGSIVTIKGRNDREKAYEAKLSGTHLLPAEKFPIAVLINKYSASASEILSAALQDHGRAVIIGERSYGKGSVQNIIRINEGDRGMSALKLTTASYWRPSGKNIHRFPDSKETDEWGVKPDPGYEITMKDEERLEYMIDRNRRDVVRGKEAAAAKPKDDKNKDKKPFEDRVLKKAMEYMHEQIKKSGAAALTPQETANS
ncbi:MAG: S41 family peptidase [Gemmataceae bacterium]